MVNTTEMVTPDQNLYFNIVNKIEGRCLDAPFDEKTMAWVLTPLHNDHQAWRFKPVPETTNAYYIVNKLQERCLDAPFDERTSAWVLPALWNDHETWILEPVEAKTNEFYIRIPRGDRYLDAPWSGKQVVWANPPLHNDHQTWTLQPAVKEPDIRILNLTIEEPDLSKEPLKKVDILSKQTISNDSGATITKVITQTTKKTSTFEWGLTQKLGISRTLTANVGIPKIGSVDSAIQMSLELGSHQTKTEAKEESYKVSESIEVPANSSVTVSGTMNWADNVESSFTCEMRVKMQGDTVDGTDKPLKAAEIMNALKIQGCEGVIQDDNIDKEAVIVTLKGKFSGSYGLEGVTIAKGSQ